MLLKGRAKRMSYTSTLSRWRRAFMRFMRVVTRPVQTARKVTSPVIKTNRGYGATTEVFLIGRVVCQSPPDPLRNNDGLLGQFRDVRRRIMRRAIPGIGLVAKFYGAQERVTTDKDGYFRVHIQPHNVP